MYILCSVTDDTKTRSMAIGLQDSSMYILRLQNLEKGCMDGLTNLEYAGQA